MVHFTRSRFFSILILKGKIFTEIPTKKSIFINSMLRHEKNESKFIV